MSNVPSGWIVTKLCELVSLKTGPFGSSLHQSDYVPNGIPIINPMHITNSGIYPTAKHRVSIETAKRLSEFMVKPGDVVMGRRGEMGRCAVVRQNESGWLCGTGSLILRNDKGFTPDFLQYYLSSDTVVNYLLEASVGSTMANINQGVLLSIDVPLPPTTEQTRIVEKLEELLTDLDAGVAELKAAQCKLAQYRQSLLKAAVSGALTAAWRAQHPPAESGTELLQRILRQRRARWEARQLARFQEQGKTPPKDWQARYPEPVAPDPTGLPELPEGWVWATIDQLVNESLIGIDRGLPQQNKNCHGIPYVKMNNVTMDGQVHLRELVCIEVSDEELGRYRLADGDILFNTRNSKELVGKTGIVHGLVGDVVFNNNLMRLRFDGAAIPDFVCIQMCSPEFRERMEVVKKATTNVAAIYAKDFFPLTIAVPPLAEQEEIASSIQIALGNIASQVEAIEHGLKQAAAQRKNILKAAFSGQLVAQDPHDEPASVLLERIRAARSAQGPTRKPRGRKAKAPA